MGMFDWVKFDHSILPIAEKDREGLSVLFQTKDFDCMMTTIHITSEGRLAIERCDTEVVPKEKRPHPDAPKGSLLSLRGSVRRFNERLEDLNFHGIFNFYDYTQGGEWFEFDAKFTDGQLVGIERVEGLFGNNVIDNTDK